MSSHVRLRAHHAAAILIAAAACSGPSQDADAGSCAADESCDDGRACNGVERCESGTCVAGEPPDCDDGVECTIDLCAEAAGGCVNQPPDRDGDGHADVGCGGDDCDDEDPTRHPGNVEICDDGDEDCDPTTFGLRDVDGDGYVDARCCADGLCGDDCDDALPGAHPGEAEVCDGFDNDCDDAVDEGVLGTFFEDADGDGFAADGASAIEACHRPPGTAVRGGDCDDADRLANPALPELCDDVGRDDDCDGEANPAARCDCSGTISRACDGLLGRCALGVEECVDGRWTTCSIRPVPEECNEIDDDCDGAADEDLDRPLCFPDFDLDGFAEAGATAAPRCPVPGRTAFGGCPLGSTDRDPAIEADCDDLLASRRPTAIERPFNEIDDDCDGAVDEGE